MAKAKKAAIKIIPDETIIRKIYVLRGQKVMLDFDLSAIYEVETRRLNEQVKRNIDRFPDDFMFRLTAKEWNNMMSQIATSSSKNGIWYYDIANCDIISKEKKGKFSPLCIY